MKQTHDRFRHGHFSKAGDEFVITDPEPSRPWLNYMANEKYGAAVSQVGGGYSMFGQEVRVNPYDVFTDCPGKVVYVRDDESGKYWTINWNPVRRKPQKFQTTVGLGYSTLANKTDDIEGRVTYFVTRNDPAEIWLVSVRNASRKTRKISLFPCVQWRLVVSLHPDAYHQWYSYADWRDNEGGIIASCVDIMNKEKKFYGFMATTRKLRGYDASGYDFYGHIYAASDSPRTVVEGQCRNRRGLSEQTVGAFHHSVSLKPGQEMSFGVVVGFSTEARERKRIIRKYSTLAAVRSELRQVKQLWKERTGRVVLRTPDRVVDRFVNHWLAYQVCQCSMWCRSPSARFGYRDVLQDVRGVLSMDPATTRRRLLEALQYQFNDGLCVRQWSRSGQHDVRKFMDSSFWITFTLTAYIKETGDFDILKEKVKFMDRGKATVYEHAKRGLEYIHKNTGQAGLALVFGGDVHDGIDWVGQKGKGVSVWLSMALHWGLAAFADLAETVGDKKTAQKFRRWMPAIRKAVNENAWDGKWFIRGIDDDGKRFGSKKDDEARIWGIVQGWASMSDITSRKRLLTAFESVDRHLLNKFGIKAYTPPYTKPHLNIGALSVLPDYSNGNIYVHTTSMFYLGGLLAAGQGDKALDLIHRILPCDPNKDPEVGPRTEPYAVPTCYVAADRPDRLERAGISEIGWLTGSAGWLFCLATERLTGVIPDYEGLRIDPCISSAWRKLGIRRLFRGAVYDVEILNPDGVQKGVKGIQVDGKELRGNLVPAFRDGKTHRVRVVMG